MWPMEQPTYTYSSGDTQTLPHAVITAKYNHIVKYYQQYCKETAFESLSETALLRIQRALKPSQRRSLAGLDEWLFIT